MISDQRDPIADFLARADLQEPSNNPLDEALPDNGPQIDQSRDLLDASEVLEDQSALVDAYVAAEAVEQHDVDLSRFDEEGLTAFAAEPVDPPEIQALPDREPLVAVAPPPAGGLFGMLRARLARANRHNADTSAPSAEADAAGKVPSDTSRSGLTSKKKDGVAPRKVALVVVMVLIGGMSIVAKLQTGSSSSTAVSVPLLDENGTGLATVDDVYTQRPGTALPAEVSLPDATDFPDERIVAVDIRPTLDLSTPPVFPESSSASAIFSGPDVADLEALPVDEDATASADMLPAVTIGQLPDIGDSQPLATGDPMPGSSDQNAGANPTPAEPKAVALATSASSPQSSQAVPHRSPAKSAASAKPSKGGNTRAREPEITVHGLMVSADCWSCGSSAVLGTQSGSVVVNDGDTWSGYRVRIAGDVVTLSDAAGQWSFLPER